MKISTSAIPNSRSFLPLWKRSLDPLIHFLLGPVWVAQLWKTFPSLSFFDKELKKAENKSDLPKTPHVTWILISLSTHKAGLLASFARRATRGHSNLHTIPRWPLVLRGSPSRQKCLANRESVVVDNMISDLAFQLMEKTRLILWRSCSFSPIHVPKAWLKSTFAWWLSSRPLLVTLAPSDAVPDERVAVVALVWYEWVVRHWSIHCSTIFGVVRDLALDCWNHMTIVQWKSKSLSKWKLGLQSRGRALTNTFW